MAPRTTFPGSGPDQTVFMTLLAVGFGLGILGYLTGSRTLRLAGILVILVATGLFLADVVATSPGYGGAILGGPGGAAPPASLEGAVE